MICPKHGLPMEPYRRANKGRHPKAVHVLICTQCQVELRLCIKRAQDGFRRNGHAAGACRKTQVPTHTVAMPRD